MGKMPLFVLFTNHSMKKVTPISKRKAKNGSYCYSERLLFTVLELEGSSFF